jgi:DNA-binding MarR family transcriptional regulator
MNDDSIAPPPRTAFGNGIQDELELLFFEVNALANRLKVVVRQVHLENHLPANGRAILQMLIRNGPRTVPQLARARATSRQSIQILVNRFESQGWLRFTSNPEHKRSDLVQLTGSGKELLLDALHREAYQLAPRLSDIDESEAMASAQLLRTIREALDSSHSGHSPAPDSPAPERSRKKRRSLFRSRPAVESPPQPAPTESDELPVNLL